jgi:integrase
MVGRRRKSNHNLPPRVVINHGAYYYIHKSGKWEKLSRVGQEADMRRKWALLEDPAGISNTTSALIDEYLVKVAPKKAERTCEDNKKEAEYLRAYFGKMKPENILPMHVGAYLETRAEGGAPVRANREKALLSHIFTWAMRQEKWGTRITFNPCRGVHRNPEKKRERMIEDAEYNAVYALATKSVQLLMDLIYRTCQRPEDLIVAGTANIKTVDISGTNTKIMRIRQLKTGKLVEIIVTPEIENIIQRAASDKINGLTFVHDRKGQPYTYDGLAAMFRRYVKKAGLSDFGMYDIKGKGATDMYRAGVPLEKIQMLLGHESVTTTEIYIKARLTDPVMPNQRKISQMSNGRTE